MEGKTQCWEINIMYYVVVLYLTTLLKTLLSIYDFFCASASSAGEKHGVSEIQNDW